MNTVSKSKLSVRVGHSAVRLDNFIIIIGGLGKYHKSLSTRVIKKYNLCTEEWHKVVIPKKRDAPDPFYGAIAVAIGGIIYTFGGKDKQSVKNELWALNKTKSGCFKWSCIKTHCKGESPSPRYGHTGWEYAGKLWAFGGLGPSPEGYLNCHGDVARLYLNYLGHNQLLSYDPNTKKWTNPQCFGAVPVPRASHASAIIKKKVFLVGGANNYNMVWDNDFFQLDMQSLTWTQLGIGQPSPQACSSCSLTAISDNQLVFHGGYSTERGEALGDTWILDGTSYSWRLYTSRKDHCRQNHTATLGLNSSVIIMGGYKEDDIIFDMCDTIFYVKLEPSSLQELALRTICKRKADLPWKCLPKKLIALLGISANGQASGNGSSNSPSCTNHSSWSCKCLRLI